MSDRRRNFRHLATGLTTRMSFALVIGSLVGFSLVLIGITTLF